MIAQIAQQEIVARLQSALPDLLAVYLFGSHAQGQAGPDSDLDLAVLTGRRIAPLAVWELSQALAAALDSDVDLVDMRSASTVLQYQVITTGVRLWASNAEAGLFECMVLSEKTELDTARAGLMQDIQREGSVYGAK